MTEESSESISKQEDAEEFWEGYPDPNQPRLDALTAKALTPLVRRAVGRETATVTAWHYRIIKGAGGDGGEGRGVYRFWGQADDAGPAMDWAMVLKIVRPEKGRAGNRELHVYRSGLLDDLPSGLSAPQCWGITEFPNGEFGLWLEEVIDEIGDVWPLARFRLAAQHLGQFNGAYLSGQCPLPAFSWISRKRAREELKQRASAMAQPNRTFSDPLMQKFYPPDIVADVLDLWAQRETWLTVLERLPQTLCYRDAWRPNLFSRQGADGQTETVAVDWPFVSIGAVGEELAPLVWGGHKWDISVAELRELDRRVFAGYLDGLRDVNWRGDPRLARLGLVLSAPLRYTFVYVGLLDYLDGVDQENPVWLKEEGGKFIEKSTPFIVVRTRFMLELAEEAADLLKACAPQIAALQRA